MRRIAVMQPYLFPYIGYFQLINAADKFVILDDVNYINRGWINRNRILINGKDKLFTISLKEASQNKLINEIEIIIDEKWKEKLLRTIELSYKHAPYFSQSFSLIQKIILNKEQNLSAYIYYSLKVIAEYLSVMTEIVKTSTVYLNKNLKAQDKILDICRKENATDYINPIGGVELYDKNTFIKKNIKLHFIKSDEIIYKQFNNSFVPWLSIIDVMMFNSPKTINDYLKRYILL